MKNMGSEGCLELPMYCLRISWGGISQGLRQGYLWEPAKPDSNLTKYWSSKMAALSLRKTNYGAFFLIRNFGCLIFVFHQWRRFFYPSYYGHHNCLGKYGFRHLCWVVRCQALHVPEGSSKFDAMRTSIGNDVGNNAKGNKIVAKMEAGNTATTKKYGTNHPDMCCLHERVCRQPYDEICINNYVSMFIKKTCVLVIALLISCGAL